MAVLGPYDLPTPFDADEADVDDEALLDELEDYDSQPFWRPARRAASDYLDSMWDRRGFGAQRLGARVIEQDIVIAHGMVQSFLNAFARDGFYDVVFSKTTTTAGTDMKRRKVYLTIAPVVDPNLTPQEAGRILIGLGVHEIGHPRYGRNTWKAVQRVFPGSAAAQKLGNLLDDVRIEQRFVGDYPGYSGVFDPTLEYVSKGILARNKGDKVIPSMGDQLSLATLAVRYPDVADWKFRHLKVERDWWRAWADRWAVEDSPRRHIEAIREALRHIVAAQVLPGTQPGDGSPGDGQQAPTGGADGDEQDDDTGRQDADSDGSGGNDSEDEKIDAEGAGSSGDASHDAGETDQPGSMSDEELGKEADSASTPSPTPPPTCSGSEAVEAAARQQGTDSYEIVNARDMADEVIENAKYYEDDGNGRKVEVCRSLKGLINTRLYNRQSLSFAKSDVAARYIRDAILQSRTGHTAVSHYKRSGRLDSKGLHRAAQSDFRLFDRKTATSPGRFLIWMMLDRSGSMDGKESIQAAQVATAIADATRHVKTVRAQVWAWSDAFRQEYGSVPGAAKVWETGQPTSEIARSIDLRSGGTPDAQIMGWAQRAIRAEVKRGEQPVIIFCSDGWGSDDMTARVEEARKAGVLVYSVAFGNLDEEEQTARFGRNGFVPWQGDIIRTARPLSKMIARLVGRDNRRRT
jgi:hypothetical protein